MYKQSVWYFIRVEIGEYPFTHCKLAEMDPIIGKFLVPPITNEWWKCYLLSDEEATLLRLLGVGVDELLTEQLSTLVILGNYMEYKHFIASQVVW